MRNGQCNCRGPVFKPPTDSRCLNLNMMPTFQVSKWFIYQKHKLNGARRNIMTCTKNSSILTTHYINVERIEREKEREREFDLNSPFISGNKVQGIQNQRSVSLSSTRSKMIVLSLKKTTTLWGHVDHHYHYPHWLLLCCFSGVLLSGDE